MIKSKWYPLVLIGIFSILFFELSFWAGLAVGYLHYYGLGKRIEISSARATAWEQKLPFSKFSDKPCK